MVWGAKTLTLGCQTILPEGEAEHDMAKGQKRSNKEARKPKKEVAKPPVGVSSVLRPEHKK